MTNTFCTNSANAKILHANNEQQIKNDNIIRIICAIQAGKPIPPDLSVWLIDGLNFFLSGRCKTLCSALGLRRKRGERKDSTKSNIEIRNHFLRRCICRLTGKTTREFEFCDFAKLSNEITRWDTVTRKNVSRLPDYELTKI